MAIEPGQRLGSYEVLSRLGAGGMGEVYRARDESLGREVAIKVLPREVAVDPERSARFGREARVLASLNHPNIATVHGFETEDSTSFLVMELVEGETLAERISHGPLPLDEAVQLFLQIAEGLEAAHERGVVHRDLKPANISLTEEAPGTPPRAKILDFGLAKALAPEELSGSGTTGITSAESPTLTYLATMRGEILGTAAYMSPEQARGRRVDRRTDVWAFGACLYEALTGVRPFDGETPTDVIAQVVTRDPDWDLLPDATPVRLRRLLRRALERDPRRRLRDIGEAWVELDAVASGEGGEPEAERWGPSAAARPVRPTTSLTTRLAWLAGGALLAGVATWVLLRPEPDPPPPLRRFAIDIGPTAAIPVLEVSNMLALSPDGNLLAVSVNRGGGVPELFLRRMDRVELVRVPDTSFAYTPFFSPDGEWIGFHEPGRRELKKIRADGSPAQVLCDAYPPLGGTWLEDDTIVFSTAGPNGPTLFRVPATGGSPEMLTEHPPGEVHIYPTALPGGKGVLFLRGRPGESEEASGSVELLDLATGKTESLIENASAVAYAESGHLLFVRQGSLWAALFDAASGTVVGPEVLAENGLEGGRSYVPLAVSQQGQLVYAPAAGIEGSTRLAWIDRSGNEESIDVGTGAFRQPRVSPDGRRFALVVPRGGTRDLWIYDLTGRPPIRLTSGEFAEGPVWTPDGERITYQSGGQIRSLKVAAAESAPRVLEVPTEGVGGPSGWTPDGRELLIALGSGSAGEGAHVLVVTEDGERRPLMETRFHVARPALSPDGRWVAYASNATGAFEIYVRPYPGPGPEHRVSFDGAQGVAWSPEGREIYFTSGRRMMAASFAPGPEPEIGVPVELFSRRLIGWDVAPDGRFLAVVPTDADAASSTHLVLVDGFFAELERIAPRSASR